MFVAHLQLYRCAHQAPGGNRMSSSTWTFLSRWSTAGCRNPGSDTRRCPRRSWSRWGAEIQRGRCTGHQTVLGRSRCCSRRCSAHSRLDLHGITQQWVSRRYSWGILLWLLLLYVYSQYIVLHSSISYGPLLISTLIAVMFLTCIIFRLIHIILTYCTTKPFG